MTPATAAIRYAERGLRVLPIRERHKEPLLQHGVHDASNDPARVRDWWATWPTANVAIAVPHEWLVIDVDPRNGGDTELDKLQREHGVLPTTITARTGSGGSHLLFARPCGLKLRGKIASGIDVLGVGRYFLVAPSVHPCGGRYRWTSARGMAIAQPPRWLLDLVIVRDAPATAVQPIAIPQTSRVERARRYLAACPPAISGQHGHDLTFTIAQKLVRGFALSETEAFALLMSTWNRTCVPPWQPHALARKIQEAARAGRMPVGALLNEQRSAS